MALPGEPAPTFFAAYGEWMQTPPPSWDDLAWLREQWDGPVHAEGRPAASTTPGARSSIGATAISVSNHGGNNLDGTPASIRGLPAVVEAVGDQIEVVLDGGIRRGSDVVKALALGARAVMIGRAYLWGLAANGQAGVENVLDILRGGIDSALLGLGHASIAELSPADIVPDGFARRCSAHELAERDLAAGRRRAPRSRRHSCSRSRSARPSSTDRTCRSSPTPTSPSPWPARWRRGARRCVVAPPLAYGSSGEHAGFAGHAVDRWARRPSWSSSSSSARRRRRSPAPARLRPRRQRRAARRRRRRLRAEGRGVRAWFPRSARRRPRRAYRDLDDARAGPGTGCVARAERGNAAPLAELMHGCAARRRARCRPTACSAIPRRLGRRGRRRSLERPATSRSWSRWSDGGGRS